MAKNTNTPEQYTLDRSSTIPGYPELRWSGKRPFTSTQYYPAQLKETYGDDVEGWRNKLYWGDNLQVMSHLLRVHRGRIQLVYIDPPFDSKADYKMTIKVRGEEVENERTALEQKQYADLWVNDEYLQFMYERLLLIRELLAPEGCLFLHCDWHQSHRLRLILDEVFGPQAFQNDLIWHYYNKMQGNIGRFASNHDIIYFYSKTPHFKFHKLQEPRDQPVTQIKRVWDKATQSLVNARDEKGNIIYIESTHKTLDDVWRLSMLQPADRTELTGYPTQKPESLVERIVRAVTDPGDLVFDCFMGSGTTQAVAMKLGRRFIGSDINLGAINTTLKRLQSIASEIGRTGPPPPIKNGLGPDGADDSPIEHFYTGIDLHTVNNYDVFRNPAEAKQLLMEAYGIQPMHGSVFDGELDGRKVKIMPINRIATAADLNEIIAGLPHRDLSRKAKEQPGRPVERITLICMGHDPDLKARLEAEVDYKLDVEVVDVLRDKAKLEFKREAEAKVITKGGKVIVERFYPMNLLQKLSLERKDVGDWRELVDSVKIDFYYDGAVLNPQVIDIPEGRGGLVLGSYSIPKDAGRIMVKITDVLSESIEVEVDRG